MSETDEWLRLNRPARYYGRIWSAERRAERERAHLHAHPEPVRHSASTSLEYQHVVEEAFGRSNASTRARRRKRFWDHGQRNCHICDCRMTMELGRKNTLTIDHLQPLSRDGKDGHPNLAACCHSCNHLKGDMTEAEFWFYRAHNARPVTAPTFGEGQARKHVEFMSLVEIARTERESMAVYTEIMEKVEARFTLLT